MHTRTHTAHITDDKGKGKVLVESEGFMNALSSQAAKMKEKKIKKVGKVCACPHTAV